MSTLKQTFGNAAGKTFAGIRYVAERGYDYLFLGTSYGLLALNAQIASTNNQSPSATVIPLVACVAFLLAGVSRNTDYQNKQAAKALAAPNLN